MNTSTASTRRSIVLAGTASALLLALAAGPASARPDHGDPVTRQTASSGQCALERVGAHYVRCDDATGNGVPAPAWIPER